MSKKSPQLRFEGFTDDWEERKLGELLKSAYQGINTAGDKVIYSEKGVEILQSKHITSGYITFDDTRFLDKKRYSGYFPKYVPKKHDILFANIGTIGPSTVVETNKEFLIAWNILKMTPNENVNSKFIELFLQILNEKHYYEKITTGNATKFVNKDAILNIELCISSFKEQQKIGSFFQQLDNTIALHQRKLDLLKEQKKGYLQKMFPKNGAKVPELRFAGFADDWEERKLGDYIIQYSEKTKQNNQYPVFTSSRNGLFFQKDYYKGNQIASEDNTGYNIVPRGYFTYRHMSDDLVFKFNINDLADYGIVSTLYPVFTTNEQLDSKYLQYQLNKGSEFRRFSLLQKQGGSRTYMYLNKLQNMILTIPKLEEQQKIGSFFKQLDDTIALHQRKLDLLKEQKKGFLQKMFV